MRSPAKEKENPVNVILLPPNERHHQITLCFDGLKENDTQTVVIYLADGHEPNVIEYPNNAVHYINRARQSRDKWKQEHQGIKGML